MAGNIVVDSGVSWLHDTLKARINDRAEALKEVIASGVPDEEYKQFVGRYREIKRTNDLVAELFVDFYQSDDEGGDELGDLDG